MLKLTLTTSDSNLRSQGRVTYVNPDRILFIEEQDITTTTVRNGEYAKFEETTFAFTSIVMSGFTLRVAERADVIAAMISARSKR